MKANTRLRESEILPGAATIPEAKEIRALVNRHEAPQGVRTWSAEYGEDSTGEPAVWIWFHFKDEDGISQGKIHELTDFVQSVRSDLLDANIGRWPYVGFRNPDLKR